MYNVILEKKANKSLNKILKSDNNAGERISNLIKELGQCESPMLLPNATKLVGYANRYRWRVGKYRIVGEVENDILTIVIIKISKREDAYD